jgi:hypothetical protein
MKCTQCGESLPFLPCAECGAETPAGSLYCCQCGRPVKKEEKVVDLTERTLCSDGNCIGTINENEVCNICGKPYAGGRS